jgi:hypothetical protein
VPKAWRETSTTRLELAQPSDVYTHAEFHGHPDHAEVHRQVVAGLRRRGEPVTSIRTLIHPAGTGKRMCESAYHWPNPAQDDVATPFNRFTPHLDFDRPPVDSEANWGPLGPPDELVESSGTDAGSQPHEEPEVAGDCKLSRNSIALAKGRVVPSLLRLSACVRQADRILLDAPCRLLSAAQGSALEVE